MSPDFSRISNLRVRRAGRFAAVALVACLTFASVYVLVGEVLGDGYEVYSFETSSEDVPAEVLYVTPSSKSCPDTGGEQRAGTFVPGEGVVLVKARPGEKLRFCNGEKAFRGESFEVPEELPGGVQTVEVAGGEITLNATKRIG
jgi:hypothetical protein